LLVMREALRDEDPPIFREDLVRTLRAIRLYCPTGRNATATYACSKTEREFVPGGDASEAADRVDALAALRSGAPPDEVEEVHVAACVEK
jgi:hypothetical protein